MPNAHSFRTMRRPCTTAGSLRADPTDSPVSSRKKAEPEPAKGISGAPAAWWGEGSGRRGVCCLLPSLCGVGWGLCVVVWVGASRVSAGVGRCRLVSAKGQHGKEDFLRIFGVTTRAQRAPASRARTHSKIQRWARTTNHGHLPALSDAVCAHLPVSEKAHSNGQHSMGKVCSADFGVDPLSLSARDKTLLPVSVGPHVLVLLSRVHDGTLDLRVLYTTDHGHIETCVTR